MEERELRRAIQDKKMNFISERDATSSYRKEQKLMNLLAAGRADEVDLREEFHFLPENIYDDAVMTYKGDVKQTEYLLVAMVRAVDESALPETDRKELLLMLEGYSAALDTRDTLMIKALWLGVKRALVSCRMCPKEIAAMDELLRLYLVSK